MSEAPGDIRSEIRPAASCGIEMPSVAPAPPHGAAPAGGVAPRGLAGSAKLSADFSLEIDVGLGSPKVVPQIIAESDVAYRSRDMAKANSGICAAWPDGSTFASSRSRRGANNHG